MRFLDTREQKSPRFLVDAFPDIEIKPLAVGDYFSGEQYVSIDGVEEIAPYDKGCIYSTTKQTVEWLGWKGNLVEIKIGPDFGLHTEQLERFQEELSRMSSYRQKNPHVQLHAVWVRYADWHSIKEELDDFRIEVPPDFKQFVYRVTGALANYGEIVGRLIGSFLTAQKEYRQFNHYCFKYHVWGHIFETDAELIKFLKDLDQPSSYKEFEPFIKRSHEEPTILAKMLRQFPGISSEKAIELATTLLNECLSFANIFIENAKGDILVCGRAKEIIYNVIGRKKDGTPKKLAVDFIHWLETGEI